MNDKPTTDQSKSLRAHDERLRKLERDMKDALMLSILALAISIGDLVLLIAH